MTGPEQLPPVTLELVTDANRSTVEALGVSPRQQNFVASVSDSIKEAADTPQAMPWYRAIYADGEPVGFVMISDNIPPGDPELLGPYYLWRLLIDEQHQTEGYGTAALDEVVAYVKTRPGGDVLLTSVNLADDGPLPFYLKYGFERTEQIHEGERVLVLKLDD
ncbi:MAG TPA: GNAT family N-acetyltransferase [Actinomycetes bacterium]|nr:GNAT family N-acetyltransferase [Actinomycetes bacterium]